MRRGDVPGDGRERACRRTCMMARRLGIGAAGEHRGRDDVEGGLGHVAVDGLHGARRRSRASAPPGPRPPRSWPAPGWRGRPGGTAAPRCAAASASWRPREVRMPSPSVCCEHPLLERRLGKLRTRCSSTFSISAGPVTQAMTSRPLSWTDDRLLVDLPRQARERIAHEAQQELAQRQRPRRRPRRSADRARGVGLRCEHGRSWCAPPAAAALHGQARVAVPITSRRCAPGFVDQAKSLQPPLHAVGAGRQQHEGPQEGRAPVGELKLEPRHLE